ncbi:hypothetical protein RRG08_044687 [Elysia crispata]|uniref:Uncharacterized protein n=1 Tax=Elysia crispata TaxID=231223 RepID=A0AAE0ZZY3_9GAST|nr:hypothetical protein RRG08_044687 [Elysia crispata]
MTLKCPQLLKLRHYKRSILVPNLAALMDLTLELHVGSMQRAAAHGYLWGQTSSKVQIVRLSACLFSQSYLTTSLSRYAAIELGQHRSLRLLCVNA